MGFAKGQLDYFLVIDIRFQTNATERLNMASVIGLIRVDCVYGEAGAARQSLGGSWTPALGT